MDAFRTLLLNLPQNRPGLRPAATHLGYSDPDLVDLKVLGMTTNWYPTWLAQAAALIPNSKLIDAAADKLSLEQVLLLAKGFDICILHTSSSPGENETLVPASYTNYGTSSVEFSAPGGSVDYPGNEGCVVAGLARPCWVFDLVFSTGNGGWYWSGGTSMAAPHAAGVAALIISEAGGSGSMSPARVEAAMRQRAIDLGKPGADDFFGRAGQVHSGY